MNRWHAWSLLAVAAVLLGNPSAVSAALPADRPIAVGYVNDLRVGGVGGISNLNDAAVDVVVHGFVEPLADGSLAPLGEFETYRDPLVRHAHANGKAAVMSVGGALPARMRDQFAAIAGSAVVRAAFAANIVAALNAWDYDGVDIDYEFPASEEEKQDFTLLMREVYRAVKTNDTGHLVMFGVSTGYWIDQYEWDRLGAWSDLAFYFGYDWRNPANGPMTNPGQIQWTLGNHQIEASCRGAVDFMLAGGYPADKIVFGLPFYGTDWSSWYEVRQTWWTNRGSWTVHADYLEANIDGVWWTTPECILAKMDAVLDADKSVLADSATVRGIGFWEFGHEDPMQPDLSQAIRTWRELRRIRINAMAVDDKAVVTCDGVRGIAYRAETAPAPGGPWTPAVTNRPSADGPVSFTNNAPPPHTFYRIQGRPSFQSIGVKQQR